MEISVAFDIKFCSLVKRLNYLHDGCRSFLIVFVVSFRVILVGVVRVLSLIYISSYNYNLINHWKRKSKEEIEIKAV